MTLLITLVITVVYTITGTLFVEVSKPELEVFIKTKRDVVLFTLLWPLVYFYILYRQLCSTYKV